MKRTPIAVSHRPGASFRLEHEEGRGLRFVSLVRVGEAWLPVGRGVRVALADVGYLACDLAVFAARLASGRLAR